MRGRTTTARDLLPSFVSASGSSHDILLMLSVDSVEFLLLSIWAVIYPVGQTLNGLFEVL